jgi:hypothetical protein
MKKKLLCLLLCFATLFSVGVLSGCAEEEETDLDSNVNTSRTAMTISMWIISEEKVSAETEKAVEAAFNEITETKYTTHVDLIFCTEDEYKEKVDDRFNKIVNRPPGTPIKPVTKGESYKKDEEGMWVLDYPKVGEYQMDIVLITGEDMLKEYVAGNHLFSLNDALTNTYKIIGTYVYNNILENAKINGEWFAVPNNQMIGEYTYLMVNKEIADKYYYTDYFDGSTENVTFGTKTPVAELIDIVAEKEDTNVIAPMYGMANFPLVKYWNTTDGAQSVLSTIYPAAAVKVGPSFAPTVTTLFGEDNYKSFMELMFHCKENNYFMTTQETFAVGVMEGDYTLYQQYSNDYYMIPIAYPRLEDSDVFSSMFAITNYTVSDQRSMEIIKELTCRSELRNVLQYGVEGKHYVLNEDGELHRLNHDYMMNIAYTGNVMMAYPEEGMPANVWEAAKMQNLQSLLSGVFSATSKLNTVDKEAWQQMSAISESYYNRLYECETVSEFQSYVSVACAEIAASPYYKTLTNVFLSSGEFDTASLAGVLTQWWEETDFTTLFDY